VAGLRRTRNRGRYSHWRAEQDLREEKGGTEAWPEAHRMLVLKLFAHTPARVAHDVMLSMCGRYRWLRTERRTSYLESFKPNAVL